MLFSVKIFHYIFYVIICLIVGFIPSSVTTEGVAGWYHTVVRPEFTPPDWVFAPVWTILYIIMGIAWGHVNIVTQSKSLRVKQNILFLLQLFFNFIWSYIYFGAHEIGYAWLDINIIIVFLCITICFFYKSSRFAAILLIPYLLWSVYASILNGVIFYLN